MQLFLLSLPIAAVKQMDRSQLDCDLRAFAALPISSDRMDAHTYNGWCMQPTDMRRDALEQARQVIKARRSLADAGRVEAAIKYLVDTMSHTDSKLHFFRLTSRGRLLERPSNIVGLRSRATSRSRAWFYTPILAQF